jgi:hypothetical protein
MADEPITNLKERPTGIQPEAVVKWRMACEMIGF